MRHRVYGKHFGRNKDERDNLFKGLVQALLLHGTIQTSSAKAKAIKGLVDKVINLAKDKQSERRLQSLVADKKLRERLILEVVPKLGKRSSGYTSIMRMGPRLGDQTAMVKMSLIGAEELKPISKEKISKAEKVTSEASHPELIKGHHELVSGSNKKMPKQVRHDGKSKPAAKKVVKK